MEQTGGKLLRWILGEVTGREEERGMWNRRYEGEIQLSEGEQDGGLQQRSDSEGGLETDCSASLFSADTDQIS